MFIKRLCYGSVLLLSSSNLALARDTAGASTVNRSSKCHNGVCEAPFATVLTAPDDRPGQCRPPLPSAAAAPFPSNAMGQSTAGTDDLFKATPTVVTRASPHAPVTGSATEPEWTPAFKFWEPTTAASGLSVPSSSSSSSISRTRSVVVVVAATRFPRPARSALSPASNTSAGGFPSSSTITTVAGKGTTVGATASEGRNASAAAAVGRPRSRSSAPSVASTSATNANSSLGTTTTAAAAFVAVDGRARSHPTGAAMYVGTLFGGGSGGGGGGVAVASF